jgi:uncharacterized protein YndB with AHSA1/START domain
MTLISAVITIAAPPQRVFEELCDVERWPEWTASMTSVQRLDDGPLAVGSRARVRQPKLSPAVWRVVALDAQSFTWITENPGVRTIGRHSVDAREDGCEVTLEIQFTGLLAALIGRLYGKRCQEYLTMECEGLRKRCEERAGPTPRPTP